MPPERIFEVGGRIGPDGAELEPLDEAAVRAAARGDRARRASARSPSCLLHSYANPAHERRVAEILRRGAARRAASRSRARCCRCSASTSAAWRRSSTPCVMPVVSTYVARLDARVARAGHRGAAAAHEVERRRRRRAHRAPRARRDRAVGPGGRRGRRAPRRRRLRASTNLIGIDIGGTSRRHLPDPRRRARPHHQRPRRRLAASACRWSTW